MDTDRNCSIQALQLYYVNRNIIDSIQYKEDLLISIENNISDYFNKIKGWVILPDKDSTLTEAYVCCYFKKNDIEKNFIIPLFLHVREDVASYTKNKQYEHCGFETYMPAKIINNWNYINKVEIIIQNGEICVKKTILRK